MCGIVMLSGPRAAARLPRCVGRLRHRGPDDEGRWSEGDLALGFARLAINGEGEAGHQPHRYTEGEAGHQPHRHGEGETGRQPHRGGEMVGAINGEIYNHLELCRTYGLAPFVCDTEIVLPLFEKIGARVIDEIDGFYAAALLRPSSREAICLRDHMGKKPLFVGCSGGEVFVVSELKAFDACDWFKPLPRGVSRVDLETGAFERIAAHKPVVPDQNLAKIFERAVAKRMPHPDQPVGVFLSGGLDSSLVAAFVSRLRDDATYFTLGNQDGPDRQAVESLVDWLGIRDLRRIELPAPAQIPKLIGSVVHSTESYNPSIVSNGLATYILSSAARQAGIKVVLTGEGADELFGGYHMFGESEPWRETRERLIDDMQFTELRRLDMSCMANSVEPRCPFLDRAVRAFSDGLGYARMYNGKENKVALRRCFEGVLPPEILHRRKTSFDVGSGIRGNVVRYLRQDGTSERTRLKKLWSMYFTHDASEPYFHAYPVFDDLIDRRGATHR